MSVPAILTHAASTAKPLSDHRRESRQHLAERLTVLAFIVDAIVAYGMLLFSYAIRFRTPLREIGIRDDTITLLEYTGQMGLGVSVIMALLMYFGVYNTQRLGSFVHAASGISKAAFGWLLAFMSLSLMLRLDPSISRLYCAIAAFEMMVGLLTWRLFFSRFLRRESMANKLRARVLFVGWTEECNKIFNSLGPTARHGYEIVGVLPSPQGYAQAVPPLGVSELGQYDELRDILTREQIDVVLVSDLTLGRDDLITLSNLCEKELVEYKILPSAFQIMLSGLHLETLGGAPVLGVSRLPLHSPLNQFFKRCVDIVGSIIGIIFGLPLILIFGYLVKRESPGDIFYQQVRLGRNGKKFTIYKIRSMRVDAEANGKVGWSTAEDPRRLKIGGVIRKWNIDEIPQFWNVLKGEMSLVGPRPERPELIHNFREVIPHYNARHNIKPGITGWAQINGLRGDTDLTERIKFDLFYIENWNLLLDFQIMMLTFIKRDNAY